MKTAIYIEGADFQIVLTPENEVEKALLKIPLGERKITVQTGGFYRCRGGWHREGENEASLIVQIEPQIEPPLGSRQPGDPLPNY